MATLCPPAIRERKNHVLCAKRQAAWLKNKAFQPENDQGEENMSSRIPVYFMGMDGWDRAVFATPDRRRFFKSVELMPHPDFHSLPESVREALLRSLHDTDGPDGEPGWPVPRETV